MIVCVTCCSSFTQVGPHDSPGSGARYARRATIALDTVVIMDCKVYIYESIYLFYSSFFLSMPLSIYIYIYTYIHTYINIYARRGTIALDTVIIMECKVYIYCSIYIYVYRSPYLSF